MALRRRRAFAAQHHRSACPALFTWGSKDANDTTAATVTGVPAAGTSIALARTRRGGASGSVVSHGRGTLARHREAVFAWGSFTNLTECFPRQPSCLELWCQSNFRNSVVKQSIQFFCSDWPGSSIVTNQSFKSQPWCAIEPIHEQRCVAIHLSRTDQLRTGRRYLYGSIFRMMSSDPPANTRPATR